MADESSDEDVPLSAMAKSAAGSRVKTVSAKQRQADRMEEAAEERQRQQDEEEAEEEEEEPPKKNDEDGEEEGSGEDEESGEESLFWDETHKVAAPWASPRADLWLSLAPLGDPPPLPPRTTRTIWARTCSRWRRSAPSGGSTGGGSI
jgi:hypothetical protein